MSTAIETVNQTRTASDETYTKFGPKLKTALPGPHAKKAVADDDRLMSPSYTRSYPLVAKRGRGVRIEDVDGNEFLDFAAGIAVTSTGHCHPEVVKAIQEQAAELIHMSGTDFYYENMTRLAERLSAIAPMPGPHRFYYGNSGAEAVECAMKLARYHTGRQNIISFFGAFHGRTMGALSLTASKPQQKRRFAPLRSRRASRPLTPMRIAAAPAARRRKRHSPWVAPAISRRSSSRPFFRRKRSPPSSSNRFRARVGTSLRPPFFCRRSAASATSMASCSSRMKCRRARDGRESGGPSSTPAFSPTSSASRRASRQECRSASAWRRPS